MAALTCPGCGAALRAADVDLALGVASCRACDEVHELPRRLPAARLTEADPSGLRFVAGGRPSVSFAWRRPFLLLFLGLWCVGWDFGVFQLVSSALSGEPHLLVYGVFHIAAAVGVTLYWVALLLNRTTIAVDGPRVTVRHGPVPLFARAASFPRDAVVQVYVMEDQDSEQATTWSVHALLAPGHPECLASGLPSAGRARAIEAWLETELGIPDLPVAGEQA